MREDCTEGTLRTVDLFAGCGGMSLGFSQAGFDVVVALENWDKAISCYQENFSHPIVKMDLSDVESAVALLKSYHPQLVIGGPPCQDFSHAGQRKEGKNANLTVCYAQIVTSLNPDYFVFENVDRAKKSISYARAKSILSSAGYHIAEVILDASLCGVPQKRRRFFAIGAKHDDIYKIDNIISNSISTKPLSVKDYMGDELNINFFYRHPRNYNRRGIFSVNEPSPTIRGVNRPIPAGYLGHASDPVSKFHDVRPLSTRERARIQTFPETFILTGTKTDQEQLIGNAVPVNLAYFIATCLRKIIDFHRGESST